MTPPLMRPGSVTTPGTFAIGLLLLSSEKQIIAAAAKSAIAEHARRGVPPGLANHEDVALPGMLWDRRKVLLAMSAGAALGTLGGADGAWAQQVKWSGGTELPKLQAPANACDCHHHLYDSRYPVDPKGIQFPGDALAEDYRALQHRLGIARQVIVTPSPYGTDNRITLKALAEFCAQARAGVVVHETISDAELRQMHEQC